MRAFLVFLGVLCILSEQSTANVQEPGDLEVGHWVRVKGHLGKDGVFQAVKLELLDPVLEHTLIGRAVRVTENKIEVLGQSVHISNKTKLHENLDWESDQAQFKVSGYYRGESKFSARAIVPYRSKYDQIEGRIDQLRRTETDLELKLLKYTVKVPKAAPLKLQAAFSEYDHAPLRVFGEAVRVRDDDDYIGEGYRIGEHLTLSGRLTLKGRHEDNYDLDHNSDADRRDKDLSVRLEAVYRPSDSFYGLFGFRQARRWRTDQEDGREIAASGVVSEAYGYWRDLGGFGWDLQLGRQDFDEKREWLYDQNLDAARVHYQRADLRAEFSASTTLNNSSETEEATDNLIAYVSHGEVDRLLAAYVIDRRDPRGAKDYPFHYGLRALGEWLPDQEVWAEFSGLTGYRANDDLRAFGMDVGTTWWPDFIDDTYLSVGYAFGSGDAVPGDYKDETFRQTGMQDNNDKFGGVTSFRYYGELLDPELANLGILTLGIGHRFSKQRSLDLVYHSYAQDVAAPLLVNADLDRKPNGIQRQLGWELDLIYGDRILENTSLELVGAVFQPGSAFDWDDPVYLLRVQLRVRL